MAVAKRAGKGNTSHGMVDSKLGKKALLEIKRHLILGKEIKCIIPEETSENGTVRFKILKILVLRISDVLHLSHFLKKDPSILRCHGMTGSLCS